MKKLLITGGCGFIGSNFVRRFLKGNPDWSVRNLDKLTYAGNLENTKEHEGSERYEFLQGDICDPKVVVEAVSGVDAIIHFAAETHVDRSIDDPDAFLLTNVLGTKNLLDAALKAKIERFVHISTDEVYGSLREGSAAEDWPMAPNSPYSASKASGDLFVRSYWKTYNYPAIIVRSTNNYGPFQYPEKVIPLFVTNLFEGKKVPLYGSGENMRDWIFVEDNCKALELVFHKGTPGEAYNVGGGNEISNLELTHQILQKLGKGKDMIQPVEDRLGHDFRYSVKIDKVKALGYMPDYSFEKGLETTVEWYRNNEGWWKPLKGDKFTVK